MRMRIIISISRLYWSSIILKKKMILIFRKKDGRSGGIQTHDPFTPSKFMWIAGTDFFNISL